MQRLAQIPSARHDTIRLVASCRDEIMRNVSSLFQHGTRNIISDGDRLYYRSLVICVL